MGFTLDTTPPEEMAKRKTELARGEAKTRSLDGMPWRHHIAAQLLAGIMSGRFANAGAPLPENDRTAAKRAVQLADILIEELAK
jgi:hypothetical protein